MPYTVGQYLTVNDLKSQEDAHTLGYGVINGLKVIPEAPPSMDIEVEIGKAYVADTLVNKVAVTTLTVTAADPTNPRKDIVVCNSAGTLSIVAGTPEAALPDGNVGIYTLNPEPPSIPANSIILGEIWVPAGATEITGSEIYDKRVLIVDRLGKARLEWTADKLLKGAGPDADPTEINVPAGGVTDHGELNGLADDDHAQYLNIARHDLVARHPSGVIGNLPASKITSGRFTLDRMPSGGDGYILVGKGVGASPEWVDPPDVSILDYQNTNDEERSVRGTTTTKLKEMKVNEDIPFCAVVCEMRGTTDLYYTWVYLYKNGINVATMGKQKGVSYIQYSHILEGLLVNDLIQIYGKAGYMGDYCYVRNMRLSYAKQIKVYSVTNQDPV